MADTESTTIEAVRLEPQKTRETADRMANGESNPERDDIRALAGMVKQLAEQVERLAEVAGR